MDRHTRDVVSRFETISGLDKASFLNLGMLMNRGCIMIHLYVELNTAVLSLCTVIAREDVDMLLYKNSFSQQHTV